MPSKDDILKAAARVTAAQKASLNTGGAIAIPFASQDTEDEETREDERFPQSQPPPLSTPGEDALSLA